MKRQTRTIRFTEGEWATLLHGLQTAVSALSDPGAEASDEEVADLERLLKRLARRV